MKKTKWIILIVLSIIIIFVVGMFLYIFVGENEDTQITQKEVDEVTNNIIDEIDSQLNSSVNASEQVGIDESNKLAENGEKTDKNKKTVESQNSDKNAATELSSNSKEETTESSKNLEGGIAEKQGNEIEDNEKKVLSVYDSAFYELQKSANSIVDGLVVSIKSDYKTLKEKDEASVDNLMKLGASYTKRAKALESQVDSSVGTVLDKMEKDMESQGIDKDKIKTYRKAYEDEYNKQKETRRNAIMSKAQEMM